MTLYKVFGRNSARNRFLVVSGSFYAYTIDAYRFIGDINVFAGEADAALRAHLSCVPECRLYARPHKVRILHHESETEGAVNLHAVLESYEFLGAYTKIRARTPDGSQITSVMFGSDTEYEIGEKIVVSVFTKDVLALKEA